ncbi:hypothetical protein MMC18_007651 [Xylographa bjoerkii]|nr:hypothetical protein [Xylographa bjoerkii]
MASQASYQPVLRSSTSSDRGPILASTSSSPKLKALTLKTHILFHLNAIVCATISISCITAGRIQMHNYHIHSYKQSLITVYVALGLSLLSQLGALMAPYILRNLHVNIAWKGKNLTAPEERSVRPPPAARQRSSTRFGVLVNVLLALLLMIGGSMFAHNALLNWEVGVVGVVFYFLTGIVHLILAFLLALQLNYRVLFAVTTVPVGELMLEPKSPAVYHDAEDLPALDV